MAKKRSGKVVRIKPHTRSPRGPNKGKKRVVVPGYKRRKPRDARK
jgi:hypothetical protein